MPTARFAALLLLAAATGCASRAPAPVAPAPTAAPAPAPPAGVEEGPVVMAPAWTYGKMNLRSGPGTRHPVVAEIPAGSELRIGKPNREGWARVYDLQEFSMESAVPRGWIFTRSKLLRPTPPRRRRA